MILLFVVNIPEFFLSHRLPIAIAAKQAGFDVHVATGPGAGCDQIARLGFTHHPVPLSRSGKNPLAELFCLLSLYRLIRGLKPELVHLVTIKPVLYGGLVARLTGVSAVVAAISGLGTVFVDRERGAWLRRFIEGFYRIALGHRNIRVIFQNSEDRSVIIGIGAVCEMQTSLIKGSGVSLEEYPMHPEPEGVPVVTFAARLLKDKGVMEFVKAAGILRTRNIVAKFWLVGSSDSDNPTSVTGAELAQWGRDGLVELLGYREDIAELFAQTNIVVLPSYYGEGLPKVLIEAAACGRAVVTTDHPGCRDAIEPWVTGLLVPVRDAVALADAVQYLIEDKTRRKEMGVAGRALAEREFTIEKVVDAHLRIYQELLFLGSDR